MSLRLGYSAPGHHQTSTHSCHTSARAKSETRIIALRSMNTKMSKWGLWQFVKWNENCIKENYRLTAGKTNENYYKRKKTKTTPGQTTQQYCANLTWQSNANVNWLLVLQLNIVVFSLKSTTCLLIWLQQMPSHCGLETEVDCLQDGTCCGDFVCAPVSQAYISVFFCLWHSVSSGRHSSMQQSFEMHACLKLNQKELCSTGFALWAVCL